MTVTDGAYNVTRYTFDKLNRVKTETIDINGGAKSRQYFYDDFSNLQKEIDRNGNIRVFTYDLQHRLKTETWRKGMTLNVIVNTLTWTYDHLACVNSHEYDNNNNTIHVDSYEYDGAGRILNQRNYLVGETPVNPQVRQSYTYFTGAGDPQERVPQPTETIRSQYLNDTSLVAETDYFFDGLCAS